MQTSENVIPITRESRTLTDEKVRIENALWGLFISDALSMPAHWYYKLESLKRDFGAINGYNDAPHPHPESFMVGNGYHPDVSKANDLDRPYDILHDHIRFYNTSYNQLSIQTAERAGEHANRMPVLNERYHYHHGLKAGENTLGANLVRVLMRSVIAKGGYDQDAFLHDFISYMTTPGNNRDPYCEIYTRTWFENYSKGVAPESCAQKQRTVWSIGSHGGIIRPLVLSIFANEPYQGLGLAVSHQQLTHRSENVSSALGVLVPLLHALIKGEDPYEMISKYAKKVRLIKISGEELSKTYRAHKGPGNIPKEQMWKIHAEFSHQYLDVNEVLETYSDQEIIGSLFSTACYPEHGVPLLLCLLQRNNADFKTALLANANAGGDNVHRGMILGLLAGASNTEIPPAFKSGLLAYKELKNEIRDFVDLLQ
jgi:ADP-ribosylglycohydrolase